jgi:hypothetical protein
MKHFALVTVATLAFSGFAIAQEPIGGQDAHDAGVRSIASGQQSGGTAIRTAMGPVSAPHLPSGPPGKPEGSSSGCTAPSDSCPPPDKKAKHRHKHSIRH